MSIKEEVQGIQNKIGFSKKLVQAASELEKVFQQLSTVEIARMKILDSMKSCLKVFYGQSNIYQDLSFQLQAMIDTEQSSLKRQINFFSSIKPFSSCINKSFVFVGVS